MIIMFFSIWTIINIRSCIFQNRIAKFELISQHMPAEEMIEEDSMTEGEVVDIIIETMMMMIERQVIGDRVHHHHLGRLFRNSIE